MTTPPGPPVQTPLADPPQFYPSKAQAWWLLAVLFAGGLISYMHRLVLGVLVQPLSHDLMLSDTQVSLLQGAAFAAIYVIAGLPLGRLADRGRRRDMIVVGSIVWSVGTLLCGFSPSFIWLFGARCIVGVGEATLAPAAASMIADAFKPHERGTALGIFLTGIVLGGPTAIWFGGYVLALADTGALTYWPVIGQLPGWRLVLVILALASLLFPLAMLGVREPLRRERPSLEQFELSGALRTWKLLTPLLLGIALLSVGDYGILSWAPTALIRAFSWPADRVGAAVGLVTAVAGVTGALLGGVLADAAARRAGELARLTVTATAAVFGLAGALMIMAPHPLVVLAGVGLWMLSSSIGATSGISVLQSLVPPGLRGTGMSLVAFCNTLLGLGLGPTAVALASDAYGGRMGTSWAITTVVGPAATLSAILLATVRRSRSAKSHST